MDPLKTREHIRQDKLIEIACELYNREHRGQVTPDTFHMFAGFAAQTYLRQANEILVEVDHLRRVVDSTAGLVTAEEDKRFIEENPVNGDIDLSPYSL